MRKPKLDLFQRFPNGEMAEEAGSNLPGTPSRPPTVLKTARPTGDDTLPDQTIPRFRNQIEASAVPIRLKLWPDGGGRDMAALSNHDAICTDGDHEEPGSDRTPQECAAQDHCH